jgi:glutathione S-transferase
MSRYTLYDFLPSGNGYKVRLVLKALALPYQLVELDITTGATRTPEYLAKNPNGRIPLLEYSPGRYLAESHAIISYLAEGSQLVPKEREARALMWQWLCFEQYSLEPNVATVRFWLHELHKTPEELGERLTDKRDKGRAALAVLEQGLKATRFLVGDALSLADIGLYAYTHVAPEGGFSLDAYPAIRAWIARVEAQPFWAPITQR